MLHCFVIDDSEIVRKYTRLIFEGLGFRVSEADSAVAAMERLRTESPSFVLVDWRLPDANSIELISRIRATAKTERPHILYVVSETDVPEIQRAVAHGADGFLTKPYNREVVEMKLQEIGLAA